MVLLFCGCNMLFFVFGLIVGIFCCRKQKKWILSYGSNLNYMGVIGGQEFGDLCGVWLLYFQEIRCINKFEVGEFFGFLKGF